MRPRRVQLVRTMAPVPLEDAIREAAAALGFKVVGSVSFPVTKLRVHFLVCRDETRSYWTIDAESPAFRLFDEASFEAAHDAIYDDAVKKLDELDKRLPRRLVR